MKTEYKPKSWYKQIINIAKGQLEIEEDNYRAILLDKTKKNSLTTMSISELYTVLEHMKALGFKPKANRKKSPKSSNKAENTHTMLDKLRQIWIQMHYQGFLNDGSEPALQKWAANQSKSLNKGVAITKLEWLDGQMQYRLIEKLKQWHMRLLDKALAAAVNELRGLDSQGHLTTKQINDFKFFIERHTEAPSSHRIVSGYYTFLFLTINEHKRSVNK